MHTHMKLVRTAMAMESLTKIRTMNVNARPCGGLGFISDDDDDHEEVIKTSCDLAHSVGGKP
jgi:hypothetical protein